MCDCTYALSQSNELAIRRRQHRGGRRRGGGGSGSNDDDDGDEHPDNGGGGRRRPCAVVERDAGRGGAVRVHWLRYPESYDEWRPQADVPPGAKEGGGRGVWGEGGVCMWGWVGVRGWAD